MSEILLQIVSVASLINYSLMYGVLSYLNPEERKIWNQENEDVQILVEETPFESNFSEDHLPVANNHQKIKISLDWRKILWKLFIHCIVCMNCIIGAIEEVQNISHGNKTSRVHFKKNKSFLIFT